MSDTIRKKNKSGKKIAALIFVFFIIFCSIFFAAKGRINTAPANKTALAIVSPVQNLFSWVGDQVNFVVNTVSEIRHLYEQNHQLREEVILLRAQNLTASELSAENQRLRALLGYKQVATQFDLVAASIIGREAATWSSVVVINRGTLDGVADNMVVVTELGLVGHVIEAGLNTSKVQLILDPRSSVGTLIQRPESRVAGIVEGDINNPNQPRMVNIPKNADVQVEDMVVTSGFGGIYPKGIVVGKIAEVHNDEGGLLKHGIILTSVNFEKLEDVAVIVASREAPPEPLPPPPQTPGTESNPQETAQKLLEAQQVQQQAQQQVQQAQQQQLQQAQQIQQQAQVPPVQQVPQTPQPEQNYQQENYGGGY